MKKESRADAPFFTPGIWNDYEVLCWLPEKSENIFSALLIFLGGGRAGEE